MKMKMSIALIVLILVFSSFTLSAKSNNEEEILYKTDVFEIEQINITFESNGYELYGQVFHPVNQTEKLPGIVFCEGIYGYASAYNWIPKNLAKQGYVTLIFDPPGQGFYLGAELQDRCRYDAPGRDRNPDPERDWPGAANHDPTPLLRPVPAQSEYRQFHPDRSPHQYHRGGRNDPGQIPPDQRSG